MIPKCHPAVRAWHKIPVWCKLCFVSYTARRCFNVHVVSLVGEEGYELKLRTLQMTLYHFLEKEGSFKSYGEGDMASVLTQLSREASLHSPLRVTWSVTMYLRCSQGVISAGSCPHTRCLSIFPLPVKVVRSCRLSPALIAITLKCTIWATRNFVWVVSTIVLEVTYLSFVNASEVLTHILL